MPLLLLLLPLLLLVVAAQTVAAVVAVVAVAAPRSRSNGQRIIAPSLLWCPQYLISDHRQLPRLLRERSENVDSRGSRKRKPMPTLIWRPLSLPSLLDFFLSMHLLAQRRQRTCSSCVLPPSSFPPFSPLGSLSASSTFSSGCCLVCMFDLILTESHARHWLVFRLCFLVP